MDTKRIKQLAGLAPIVEAWDGDDFDRYMSDDSEYEDDGMSKAERALVGAADKDLAAKGIRVKDADPDADLAALAKYTPPEDDEFGGEMGEPEMAPPALQAPAPQAAAPEIVGGEEPVASSLGRGEKTAKAREYLTINPGATRKEFMTFASRELGMGAHYGNTLFYALKKKLATAAPDAALEFWVIQNVRGKVLTESGTYDLPLWSDYTDTKFNARIFENEIHAKKAIESLTKYGFKEVKLVKESAFEIDPTTEVPDMTELNQKWRESQKAELARREQEEIASMKKGK